ncbi:MAG: efflux RND transporter periplasmic adaptor subunit [Pseudomonadota bacterium]|nr:efflux RND transporter periplasmic adaptor subunit [Pseudomonadota bacterium]
MNIRVPLLCRNAVLLALVACAGCTDPDPANRASMPDRPVTVIELAARDYARESTRTGSVSLYREERIGFEVSGRVLAVLDEGLEVRGPALDEKGQLVRSGDVIATLEKTRYRLQVEALEARLTAARRDIDEAQAQLKLADQTLERQRRLLTKGVGNQQSVDDAQSVYDRAIAQLEGRRAAVNEVEEELERAREDLADTRLLAPFSGRITSVHVTQGAVVEAGTPLVTLTLMDPVQVQVEVSADDERAIQTGDRAIIYPKDPLYGGQRVPINAIVFEKGAVADPELRTFRIDLIVRNERRRVEQLYPELEGLPIVNDYLPVVKRYQGEAGPLFVHAKSVYEEQGKTYVLRLPGVGFHSGAERSAVGKHRPEKIEIALGDVYETVIKWNFRSLTDGGDLREGDFLIVGPKAEQLDGVAVGRPQWLLRPGDLVPVQFFLSALPRGYYVPIRAISVVDGEQALFVVEDGRARARPVQIGETFRELRRVEGDGISDGAKVIVDGVHYVSDGQPVSITETLP